jgi:O-antigen/teichoic acid export membrane protein
LIILTPMSILKSVGTIRGSVLMAVGRPQIELYWNLIYLLPLVGVVYVGAFWGINGVAAAYTLLYVLTFPVIQYLTDKPLAIKMREFIAVISTSAAATALMVIVSLGFRHFAVKFLKPGPLIILLGGVVVSAVVYMAAMWILDKQVFADLRAIFKSSAIPADSVISEAMIPE